MTVLITGLFGGLLIAALFSHTQISLRLIGVSVIVLTLLACFLGAPVAYEITPDKALLVKFRVGRRIFFHVKEYHLAREGEILFGLRLWGNGGLFAVTGLRWNRAPEKGFFWAYVTDLTKLVVVELENGKKIVISPENAEQWSVPG